jgi:8-oxo-dGTP pyrophosphatase MutT (NUDIX family)
MSRPPRIDISSDEHPGKHPYIRPRDASTLLILDKTSIGPVRVLMGRRHMRHTFMPGKFVFPGGRLDVSDSRISVHKGYLPVVEEKLSTQLKGPKTAARVRAFALAAIRETYEEAGIFIGSSAEKPGRIGKGFEAFEERGLELDLSPLRMVARAITPPQRPRRFDTRFLALWSDAIGAELPEGTGPSGELQDVAWLTLEEAREKDLPNITQQILADLEDHLKFDPALSPEGEAPFYFFRNGRFEREIL